MRRGWIAATAAVLLTAGWAVAQAPVPAAPAPAGVAVEAPANGAGDPWYAGLLGGPSYDSPQPYRLYGSADFLVWRINSANLPSVASTVPLGVVHARTQDVLLTPEGVPLPAAQQPLPVDHFAPVGIQSAATVADGAALNFTEQVGGRFTIGVWLAPDESLGLESSVFFLNRRSLGFNSTTGNVLNQGVVNFPGADNIFLVATTSTSTVTSTTTTTTRTLSQSFPNFTVTQANTFLAGTTSTEMWGAELNARCTSASLGAVSGLVGFRYLSFREELNVNNSARLFLPTEPADLNLIGQPTNGTNSNFPTDLKFVTADSVQTHNDFYGGQIGLDLDMFVGRFIMDVRAKVALGVMHQSVKDFSSTVTTSVPASTLPNQGIPVAGGLLSGPLDEGTHSRYRISAAPEVNVKLGYMILPSLRAYVGYDFLYVANVLRPGDQTGTSSSGVTVTVAGTPNPITVNQPAFRFKDSDIWFNGINFGLEYRY
jgi:hypothetical protein